MGQVSNVSMQWLNRIASLLKKGQPQHEYFLALIFKQKRIKAVVWEEKEGQVDVVDNASVVAEKGIEEIADEDLLKLTDEAIGLAEKTLPPNIKTKKTIFALPEWWVEGSAIKAEFLSKIKKITRELELTPLGFVVIAEAISHFLKVEEGVPPTVLLIYLSETVISVTLVQSGRIEKVKTVVKEGKSDSETVAEVIRSFGDIEVLPSRILLFDGEVSLEEAKQEFISFPWTKELSFLHFPRIDIVGSDFDAKAVVSGAAKEMGFSFEEVQNDQQSVPSDTENGQEKTEGEKEDEEEAFGFVKNRDIVEELATPQATMEEDKDDEPSPSPTSKSPMLSASMLFAPFQTLIAIVKSLKVPSITIPRLPLPSFRLWTPVIALALLLIALSAFFIFFPKATLILVPHVRTLEKDVQIAVDIASSSVDKDKKKIPATVVEIRQEGEKSQKTTGKKTVGDKARGEVTIYNKTENKKTFAKGTVLTGPSNLRFTLDDEITVASTAAFELTPSSTKAKVTAEQIGEDSNVSSNTNFPFKDFPTSSYFAKNDTPFTGGTKRDIVAVSKEDQETLLNALTEELRNKAKDELSSKSGGNPIVDIEMEEDVNTKKYNKDVGDETDSLSLKLVLDFRTLSYKDSDLLELVGSEIERDAPYGFSFKKDTFETKVVSVKKEKNDLTTLVIHYKAPLLPNIDIQGIKNDIIGKSRPAVETYLRSLPLADFTITQNVELPSPFNLLPQRIENIHIELQE